MNSRSRRTANTKHNKKQFRTTKTTETKNHKVKGQAVNDQVNKYKHWLIKQVTDVIEARIEN